MKELQYQFTNIANLATRERFFNKLSSDISLSTYRELQIAVKIEADPLHDRLAALDGFRAIRFDNEYSTLESSLDLIQIICAKRAKYSSMHLRIWTGTTKRADEVREMLEKCVADVVIQDPVFTIDWHYLDGKGVSSALIDELATDKLVDAAYPSITEGVHQFIDRYLDADQPVLVVHGPPGTGKTRLIRGILGEMARRSSDACRVMFTGDAELLKRDEIFMRFIGSGHKAFVVEDADHLLKPRKDGNESMHRFLTISDGIVRAQGRKIIFSSNLPNLGDLDDALIRPGRCFACVTLPRLAKESVEKLIPALQTDKLFAADMHTRLLGGGEKSVSLAEIYRALGERIVHAAPSVAC